MGILRKIFKTKKQIPAYKLSNNINELFDEIIQRRYWDKIGPNIVKDIIKNAEGNAESVRTFVHISERSNILQKNFLKLTEIKNEDILSLFSITLYRLGDDYHQQAIASKNDEDFKSFAMFADMAYMSSILCDKFMLPAYHGMAFLYSFWDDGKTSLEFCKKYKVIEDIFLSTSDELLNNFQRTIKQQLLGNDNFNKDIEEIKKYAPYLLQHKTETDVTYREDIERLEKKYFQGRQYC